MVKFLSSRYREILAGIITGILLAIYVNYRSPEPIENRQNAVVDETEPAKPIPQAEIVSAYYRKTTDYDPGTIRVYIANPTKEDLSIKEVVLDGLSLPCWGTDSQVELEEEINEENAKIRQRKEAREMVPDLNNHTIYERNLLKAKKEIEPEEKTPKIKKEISLLSRKVSANRVVWAKFYPPVIKPGDIGEFAAKLAVGLPRPMKVDLKTDKGYDLSTIIRNNPLPLEITAITFSSDFKKCYFYLLNKTNRPVAYSPIECIINGEKHTASIHRGEIQPGEKALDVFNFAKPLSKGSFIAFKVKSENGPILCERIRIWNGFPIDFDWGANVGDLNICDKGYSVSPKFSGEDGFEIPASRKEKKHANYIFCCQMHEYGANQYKSALETIRRYNLALKNDPEYPSFSHLCRIRPERGYALFTETADILRINPNIYPGESSTRGIRTNEGRVGHICKVAYESARPRAVFSSAHTSPFAKDEGILEPEQFRRRLFTIIGNGIKGLFYRFSCPLEGEEEMRKDLLKLISETNLELQRFKQYLAIADVWQTPKVINRNDIAAYSLLAGDEALVVIVVRHKSPKETREAKKLQKFLSKPGTGTNELDSMLDVSLAKGDFNLKLPPDLSDIFSNPVSINLTIPEGFCLAHKVMQENQESTLLKIDEPKDGSAKISIKTPLAADIVLLPLKRAD